eukprot:scaffold19009_cov98-Isochrysis_galbana.AAC.3
MGGGGEKQRVENTWGGERGPARRGGAWCWGVGSAVELGSGGGNAGHLLVCACHSPAAWCTPPFVMDNMSGDGREDDFCSLLT